MIHNFAPVRYFLVVLASVLFFLAAVWPAPPSEPHRTRLIAAGLFCWVVSTFFVE